MTTRMLSKFGVSRLALGVLGLGLSTLIAADAPKPVRVEMKNAEGTAVGTATLLPVKGGKGVNVRYNFMNMPPGEHAFHFHANAKCEGPKFESAGGHFNPESKKHGLQNPDGPHAGDMQNFTVKPNGTARGTVTDPNVTLGEGPDSLYTNGGTALMVHEKADDMKSDPAGNAGGRLACGVIAKAGA